MIDDHLKMKADLYIATRSDRSDIVKVGRSANVKQRCSALSASQCFKVTPSHIYPGCGGLEKIVHEALQRYRIDGGSGREWFRLTPREAKAMVDAIEMEERNKAALGIGPPQPKYVRRYGLRDHQAYVDWHRPPMTSEEVLRSICRGCEA